MAGREGPYKRDNNSTSYIHPNEENLNNLHKVMQYNVDGEPVLRTHVDGITLEGDVIVDKVKVEVDLAGNTISSEHPVPISANNAVNSNSNPIYVAANVTGGNVNVSGSVTVSSITNTANVNILNIPSVTVNSGNITLTTGSNVIGKVDQASTSNPWVISKNSTVNSSTNPIFVSNEGSTVQVGNFPEVSVTAFEEPLAVGITPIIQADAMYGLDPDFWITTELNGGTVSVTNDTTWQISSGTSAGGYARLATSSYMTYQPGQGSMFRWTAAFTTTGGTDKNAYGIDNIVQNTGPIDREDGYSFGFSGSTANNASRKFGILHRRAGRAETRGLTITTAPTGNQTATVTLDNVAYTISITASTSVAYTANQIANKLKAIVAAKNTWDIEACSGIVTFTYYSPGAKSGTYSFSSTGTGTLAVGTFNQIYAGATPNDTWTYVDSWDNQSIQFDPSKLNVFGIDFRWLGAGRVRFFMEDPSTGKTVLVHTQRWSSQYTVPHISKPSLRIIYRSGTTNPAVTPSQNVVVTGASVMSGIQGIINQTGSSQGWFNIDSTTRVKDTVWHLMSLQNPYVRNAGVNKASVIIQSLTVAIQATDPSVVYIIKNAVGVSDVLTFQTIPNSTNAMFVQYSISAVSENLTLDRISNVQTVGINGTATFDLVPYNLSLSPGDTVSVFINSSNAINKTATGMTWKID